MTPLESRVGYLERRVELLAQMIGTTSEELDAQHRETLEQSAAEGAARRAADAAHRP